ncbi:hypothetical protein K439DRAFT_1616977 [Ramaria rubella]|nr:hypothetical protein K439DRAFT_1616977 [Ramaria rubella]
MTLNLQMAGYHTATTPIGSLQIPTAVNVDADLEPYSEEDGERPKSVTDTEDELSASEILTKGRTRKQQSVTIKQYKKSKKSKSGKVSWEIEPRLAADRLRFDYWVAKATREVQLNRALTVKANYEAQFYDIYSQESYINAVSAASHLVTNKALSAAPVLRAPTLPIVSLMTLQEPCIILSDDSVWLEKYTTAYLKLQITDENDSSCAGSESGDENLGPMLPLGLEDVERDGVKADEGSDMLNGNDFDQASPPIPGLCGAAGENAEEELDGIFQYH